jgi:uncharacterized membrane protein YdjX (TVP38/TMEM64 family)
MNATAMSGRKKLLLIAAIFFTIAVAGSLFMREIPDTVSAPLFVLVVVIEVVIAPIPGGAIGYMGAARFGFERAWPMLYIGNIIGTTLVFWLARRFGAPVFEGTVSEASRRRYDRILRGHPLLLWIFYAVPLIPVDVLSILAGLSRMRPGRFLLIAWTGYISYTGIVAFVGAFLADFVGVTETVSVLGAIFLVAVAWWLWKESRTVSESSAP